MSLGPEGDCSGPICGCDKAGTFGSKTLGRMASWAGLKMGQRQSIYHRVHQLGHSSDIASRCRWSPARAKKKSATIQTPYSPKFVSRFLDKSCYWQPTRCYEVALVSPHRPWPPVTIQIECKSFTIGRTFTQFELPEERIREKIVKERVEHLRGGSTIKPSYMRARQTVRLRSWTPTNFA